MTASPTYMAMMAARACNSGQSLCCSCSSFKALSTIGHTNSHKAGNCAAESGWLTEQRRASLSLPKLLHTCMAQSEVRSEHLQLAMACCKHTSKQTGRDVRNANSRRDSHRLLAHCQTADSSIHKQHACFESVDSPAATLATDCGSHFCLTHLAHVHRQWQWHVIKPQGLGSLQT